MSIVSRRGVLIGAAALGAAAPAPVRVRMETAGGAFVLLLDPIRAPISAGAFLDCVRAGSYENGAFTRAVHPGNDHGHPAIAVLQGRAAEGVTAKAVAHETTAQSGILHKDGTISLPRDKVGSATGAEFFICIGDQPALDFGGSRNQDGQGFAAFGTVAEGMEIVRRIWNAPTGPGSADAYTAGQMLAPPVPIFRAVLA